MSQDDEILYRWQLKAVSNYFKQKFGTGSPELFEARSQNKILKYYFIAFAVNQLKCKESILNKICCDKYRHYKKWINDIHNLEKNQDFVNEYTIVENELIEILINKGLI
jgi:hypothetical protein